MTVSYTGTHIYYYFVCKRKLWYFSHQINMESENENVLIGKLIDETSYTRHKKHINIDNVISIDYIAEHKILHEVKKSRKIEEAGIWQLKYYLYYLEKRGVKGLSGRIDYPTIKQGIDVELYDDDKLRLDEVIKDIDIIISSELPPKCPKMKICKSCAYYDFCFI